MNIVRKLWCLMDGRQRRKFLLLQGTSALMALSTLCSVAAIVPFFAALADPSRLQGNHALMVLQSLFNLDRAQDVVVAVGVAFVFLVVTASLVSMSGIDAMNRFAFRMGDCLRQRLFAQYLHRDYPFHTEHAPAVLLDALSGVVDRVVSLMQSVFAVTSNSMVVLAILVAVIIVNPGLAVLTAALLGGCYFASYTLTRRRLLSNGAIYTRDAAARARIAADALGGIKELLIMGGQEEFQRRFAGACDTVASCAISSQRLAQRPRHVVEILAVAALTVASISLSGSGKGTVPWLSQMTFVAFAMYRLLPAVQQVFHAVAIILAHRAALDQLEQELSGRPHSIEATQNAAVVAPVAGTIRLRGVSYTYSGRETPAVSDVELTLVRGSMVAFTGANGSGKTTCADLIAGLLAPQAGSIDIDGISLTEANRRVWQTQLSYVPQEIYLLNGSVADNIALGAPHDMRQLRKAARLAGIEAFIESLPRRYDELLGDAGSRISGGQRQMLGIARALYRDKPVLILDEATSALDPAAERNFMLTLRGLAGSRTIVFVTHRTSAFQYCDGIVGFDGGRATVIRPFSDTQRQNERVVSAGGGA